MSRALIALLIFANAFHSAQAQFASPPTSVSAEETAPRLYSGTIGIVGIVHYRGPPCPTSGGIPPMPGSMLLKRNGTPVGNGNFFLAFYRSCLDGAYTAGGIVRSTAWYPFGTYEFTIEYVSDGTLQPAESAPFQVTVLPEFTGTTTAGPIQGSLLTRSRRGSWSCDIYPDMTRKILFGASTTAPQSAPQDLRNAYGYVNYDASCLWYCDFNECPPPDAAPTLLELALGFPSAVPTGARLWGYTPTRDDPTPAWRPLDATFSDRFARVTIVGDTWPPPGLCCLDSTVRFQGSLMLSVERSLPPDHDFADMWWSGPDENGWGLSIAQLGDRMHLVLFIYDQNGNPTWYVVPQGAWDATRSYFRGDIQAPSDRTGMGPVVGTATLSFTTVDSGRFDYTINGVSGSKSIGRMPIATSAPSTVGQFSGPWWKGDARGGWGVKIHQQGDTLFTIWYTGDANYKPVWYVMPGGRWNGKAYTGAIYRTHGSPWIGATYDASRLTLDPVGTMTLDFANESEAAMSYVLDGVSGEERLVRQPF